MACGCSGRSSSRSISPSVATPFRYAAYSEPLTLCRMLLKLHLNEKRTKEEKQKEGAASGPASERVREGGGGRGGER